MFRAGKIWLASDTLPPPVLCSTVNEPQPYAQECPIVSDSDLGIRTARSVRQLDIAVAISRLNPSNIYHSIFEVSDGKLRLK